MTTIPTTLSQPEGHAPLQLLAASIVARAARTEREHIHDTDPGRRYPLLDMLGELAQLEDAPIARIEQLVEQRAVLHRLASAATAWMLACDREMVALCATDEGPVAA